MPLDVCKSIEPVAELSYTEERRVYVGTRLRVADTEAAAVSVVEELHLSSLAAAASIIARKVMPEPQNAPAKNTASVLIALPPLFALFASQASTLRTYPLPLRRRDIAFEAPL